MVLTDKLNKRLELLKAAGGVLPWTEAPRQHRRLKELGLILEGHIGSERFAVLHSIAPQEEDETLEAPHGL